MAKKVNDPDPTATLTDDNADIEVAFAALPGGSYIDVYRIDDQSNGKYAFVHRYTEPTDFSPADLAARVGGGRYRLFARGKNKAGRNVVLKSPEFIIDRHVKPAGGAAAAGGAPASASSALAEVFTQQIMGQMIQMMNSTQQLNALALKSIAEGTGRESSSDKLLAAVLPALIKRDSDPTELGLKIAGLIQSGSGGGSIAKQLGELIDVADKVRPLFGDGAVDRPEPNPVVESMRMAEGMLDKYLRIRELTPTAIPAQGAPPPERSEPAPAAPPLHPMIAALDRIVPLLVVGARKNADPDDYVSLVLDQIDVAHHPTLYTTLQNPDVVTDLGRRYPAIVESRVFFGELVRLIREELASDDKPVVESTESASA